MLSKFLGDDLNVIIFKDHQLFGFLQRDFDIKANKRLSCFFSCYLNERILRGFHISSLGLMLWEGGMILVEFWRVEGRCCVKICFRMMMMHIWVSSLIRFLKFINKGRNYISSIVHRINFLKDSFAWLLRRSLWNLWLYRFIVLWGNKLRFESTFIAILLKFKFIHWFLFVRYSWFAQLLNSFELRRRRANFLSLIYENNRWR